MLLDTSSCDITPTLCLYTSIVSYESIYKDVNCVIKTRWG